MLRPLLAILHLLALGIGLGAVWARARGLGERLDRGSLRRVFAADGWWGLAAVLWIGTGLWRLLAGTEKATAYYLANEAFRAKMGFLAAILLLEVWPALTLVRWRRKAARSGASWTPDASTAARIRAISYLEALLVVAMVCGAALMARGYGAKTPLRSGRCADRRRVPANRPRDRDARRRRFPHRRQGQRRRRSGGAPGLARLQRAAHRSGRRAARATRRP